MLTFVALIWATLNFITLHWAFEKGIDIVRRKATSFRPRPMVIMRVCWTERSGVVEHHDDSQGLPLHATNSLALF